MIPEKVTENIDHISCVFTSIDLEASSLRLHSFQLHAQIYIVRTTDSYRPDNHYQIILYKTLHHAAIVHYF